MAEEGIKDADGALSLGRLKRKKGAVGGPFGRQGVIVGMVEGGERTEGCYLWEG